MQDNYTPPEHHRFWDYVLKTPACWLWAAARDPHGYGTYGGRRAHRFAYELSYGPIPDGKMICHRCNTRWCVRPDHLYIGTAADNSADMMAAGRMFQVGNRNNKHAMGEKHYCAKLTEAEVRTIRLRHVNGDGIKTLATQYGLAVSTVYDLLKRITWKQVE